MSNKSKEIEKQQQRIAKANKEKRLNIINSSYKCTICGAWVKYPSRKRHLRIEHNLLTKDIRSFFLSKGDVKRKQKERIQERRWKKYIEEISTPPEERGYYVCGEKVSGGPFVKIIYNAVGTNRRKH